MNDIPSKVKSPAIALIIVGGLNLAIGLLTIFSGLIRLTGIGNLNEVPADPAKRIGFLVGTFSGYGIAFVTILISPVIIYGAVQMLNARKVRFAKSAAILALIPFLSCCFVIGLPIGIWALIVLGKPEVKLLFERTLARLDLPPPPTF